MRFGTHRCMNAFAEPRNQQSGRCDLHHFVLKKAGESREWAPEYICRGTGQRIGQVRGREVSAKAYAVNLPARTCTCTHFQENSIPCSHADAFILFLRERPDGYFPTILSTETERSSYTENLQPVDISKIDNAAEAYLCKPPPTKLHRGKGGRKQKGCIEAGQHGQDNGQVRSRCCQCHEGPWYKEGVAYTIETCNTHNRPCLSAVMRSRPCKCAAMHNRLGQMSILHNSKSAYCTIAILGTR